MAKRHGLFFSESEGKMQAQANAARFPFRGKVQRSPLKLTALLYLKEALLTEKYEECREFVQAAREFGAQEFEIQNLLEDPRRTPV